MKLVYGFLCNFATPGAGNKPTAVGIFDALFLEDGQPLFMAPCFLHGLVKVTGELHSKHVFTFELLDDDGNIVDAVRRDGAPIKVTFDVNGELVAGVDGLGLASYLYVNFGDFILPDYGNYELILRAGGIRFAEIPLYVRKTVAGQVAQA